jgi:hypothetical protein
MAARLKVFVTSDGLTDYVVAASSRAKALAAWGVRQDVFKEGRARETDDPTLVKAALAQPGEVLRRSTGAQGKLPKLKAAKRARLAGPTPAQRRKVAELETRLTSLQAAHEQATAKLAAERAALDRKAAALAKAQARARQSLEAKLSAARRAPG